MKRILSPKGWLTRRALMEELGVARSTIELMVERFRAQGRDVVQKFWSKAGPATYIAPDAIQAIRAQVQREAPEGWVSCAQYGSAWTDVARSLYAAHPEYCEFYRDGKSGQLFLHYAQPFLERMQKLMDEMEFTLPEQDIHAEELQVRLGLAGVLLQEYEEDGTIAAGRAREIVADIRGQLRKGMVQDSTRRKQAIKRAAEARRERRKEAGGTFAQAA